MRSRGIHYLLTPIVSLFILTGCGNTSSSDTQQNHGSITNDENVAMLIPRENLQPKGEYSKAPLSLNTFSKVIKEEGRGVENWIVYDKSPTGATINIVYDNIKRSQVIQLNGEGLHNGYVLGYWTQQGAWQDQENKAIQWSMNYGEDYYVYVRVSTAKGYRYLYYTPDDYNYGIAEHYDAPHYIHHGLGSSSIDGTWKTFSRDLEADLKEFEPDNSITTVDGFFVRGSGLIDDVTLLNKSEIPSAINSAIDSWLINHGVVRDLSTNPTKRWEAISQDQTRIVIGAHIPSGPNTYRQYILDISDLNNIRKLNGLGWYRYTYPIDIKIKDNDYILIARSTDLRIYDFTTGEFLSSISSSSFTGMDYPTIQENYAIIRDDNLPANKVTLKKIDFTNRKDPIITILYKQQEGYTYSFTPDRTKIIIKDSEGNIVKEIDTTGSVFKNKVDEWLNSYNLKGEIKQISCDYSRVIIDAHQIDENNVSIPHSDTTLILNTSNPNEIQELARDNYDRYDYPVKYQINNDYILIARKQKLFIYDYQTANLLSNPSLGDSLPGVEYLYFTNKKVAYVDIISNTLKVVDFYDKAHPLIFTLHEGDASLHYPKSIYSNIKIVDDEGNLLKQISIFKRYSSSKPINIACTHSPLSRIVRTRSTGLREGVLEIIDNSNPTHTVVLKSYALNLHDNFLYRVIFSHNNYIVSATTDHLIINNTTTGEEISLTPLLQDEEKVNKKVNYLDVTTTYAIYSYHLYKNENNVIKDYLITKRIDYKNIETPIISTISSTIFN